MTDFTVRPLAEGEHESAFDVLVRSLHATSQDEQARERFAGAARFERRFGAFAGASMIGVARSFATELAVPGGKTLPAAAVDGVGVRADHTRRGVLTALMREQLRDCAARGEVFAHLHASESVIYGRFGYGVAGRALSLCIGPATFRADAPSGGRVRMLEPGEAEHVLPALYGRIGPHRPGMMARPGHWWTAGNGRQQITTLTAAVHTGEDGDDGFVAYGPLDRSPSERMADGAVLRVRDLQAANMTALAGLWRYVLGVDLVREVWATNRPVDEPLGAMLSDPRVARVTSLDDEIWLRVLDVPAALAARSYGDADPVVVEVEDAQLPENSGRYRITPDGAERTERPAALRLVPEVLGMIYLGDARPSTLAALGRIEVFSPAALPHADALFLTAVPPWGGTGF